MKGQNLTPKGLAMLRDIAEGIDQGDCDTGMMPSDFSVDRSSSQIMTHLIDSGFLEADTGLAPNGKTIIVHQIQLTPKAWEAMK